MTGVIKITTEQFRQFPGHTYQGGAFTRPLTDFSRWDDSMWLERPCGNPACDMPVRFQAGANGRPPEYHDKACRRTVEFTRRRLARQCSWPDGPCGCDKLHQAPAYEIAVTDRPKLVHHLRYRVGLDVTEWAAVATQDGLEELLEQHLATRAPKPGWRVRLREIPATARPGTRYAQDSSSLTVEDLATAGLHIWTWQEWASADGRPAWMNPDPMHGGETTTNEATGRDSLDMRDKDSIRHWLLEQDTAELKGTLAFAQDMAARQDGHQWARTWQAVADAAQAILASREGRKPVELLDVPELEGLLDSLCAYLDDLEAKGQRDETLELVFLETFTELARRLGMPAAA